MPNKWLFEEKSAASILKTSLREKMRKTNAK
jgi:hypothetical protein